MKSIGEQKVFEFIERGILSVDSDGRIWRHKLAKNHHSGYISLDVPQRAEYYSIGYLEIHLRLEGKGYRAKAHRIVWQYFNGDIPDGLEINHKDGIRDNNRPDNLEVVSQRENTNHAYRTGLAHGRPGTTHHNAKVTPKIVNKIRKLYAKGRLSQSKIGKMFNLSQGQVGKIIRGERWKILI